MSTTKAAASPHCIPKRIRTSFGAWLSTRLRTLRLSVPHFAKQVPCSRACVYFWVSGHSVPPKTKRPALALLLGVPEADLNRLIDHSSEHRQRVTA